MEKSKKIELPVSKVVLRFENMDPKKVDKGNYFQLVNP